MKNCIDLNKKIGTYANCLTNNLQEIWNMVEDYEVSAEQLRNRVLEIVAPAKDTNKKRFFVANMSRQTTKESIGMYVASATLCAEGLGSSLDYKWSNQR